MSQSHHITPFDIHPDFNDRRNPWGPSRVGQVVPDRIAVFKPVGAGIPLTTECIEEKFGVCKSSVIYDCKHNTFLVFLSNKEAVSTMVDEAGKLPEYDILAFDAEYEHFEETSGRIKEWIMQQAQDHLNHDDASDLAPKVPEGNETERSAAFGKEEHPKLHDDTSALALEAFASQPAGLAEPEGLISSNEEDPNDSPDSEHYSAPSNEADEDLQGSPLTPIQSATNYISSERHNQEVYDLLHLLVTTGPAEIQERQDLYNLLSRPPQTYGFDVQLEGALHQAVSELRRIAFATGDFTMLAEMRSAIIRAEQNLGHL